MIFPSTAGTWRDPNNFNKQWRQVRDGVGGAGVTTHSFRKTVATLIDGGGLSARIGADHLGHTERVHDTGQVHGPRSEPYRGRRPPGPGHKRRINVDSTILILKNSL